jgi:hypothetical protein
VVAVAFSVAWSAGARWDTGHLGPGHRVGALEGLGVFRRRLYRCFTGWADELFELTEAVLRLDGPVTSLPELSLAGPCSTSASIIRCAIWRTIVRSRSGDAEARVSSNHSPVTGTMSPAATSLSFA